ncbi:TPA: hypothetical protein U2M01_003732 [Enterobacter chengduensis]|nr:hypothetical protein [Enterobacter chengduensis]
MRDLILQLSKSSIYSTKPLFGSDKVASLISEAVYTDDEARKNEILEKDMIDAMKDDLRSKRT